jgi:hypothetical protein
MVSELFKHSDNKELLACVPEHLRHVHKTRKRVRNEEQGVLLPPTCTVAPLALWDDDNDMQTDRYANVSDFGCNDDDLEAIDLS